MFDYLEMAYKDSDYVIMIALVHWPKHMILGAETHLGGSYERFCHIPTSTLFGSEIL